MLFINDFDESTDLSIRTMRTCHELMMNIYTVFGGFGIDPNRQTIEKYSPSKAGHAMRLMFAFHWILWENGIPLLNVV